VLLVGFLLAVAGCGNSDIAEPTSAPPGPVTATATDGRGAVRPLQKPTDCTITVSNGGALTGATSQAEPGQRICLSGDMSAQSLHLDRSGTPEKPIVLVGDGNVTVAGIDVLANNVVVEGFNVVGPDVFGIAVNGENITVANNTRISPRSGGGVGIGFWGKNLKIVHNTVRDTVVPGRHSDCMQTSAHAADLPASQQVLLDSNRCEQAPNSCLAALGSSDTPFGGGFGGQSADIVFNNNYCETTSRAAMQFDNVQRAVVTNNEFAGVPAPLVTLKTGAINARVEKNTGTGLTVQIDNSSRPGYQGPAPRTAP
jgi:hypothetical protein